MEGNWEIVSSFLIWQNDRLQLCQFFDLAALDSKSPPWQSCGVMTRVTTWSSEDTACCSNMVGALPNSLAETNDCFILRGMWAEDIVKGKDAGLWG